jgi:hypothetical protein
LHIYYLKTSAKHAILVVMSEVPPQKNISKIRTFAKDVARLQGGDQTKIPKEEITTKPKQAPVQVIKKNTPPTNTLPEMQIPPANHFPEKIIKKKASVPPQKIETLVQEISEVSKPQKKSILSDESSYGNSVGAGGTIIRDTKRKRFRLLPSMITATVGWFTKAKEEYITGNNPVQTVAKAEVRASVIKKAASASEQAPSKDFNEVSERLKKTERIPVETTLTVKKKSEVPPPSWSYTTNEKGDADASTIKSAEPIPTPIPKETIPTIKEPESVAKEEKPIPSPAPASAKKESKKSNLLQSLLSAVKSDSAIKTPKAEKVTVPKPKTIPAKPVQSRTEYTATAAVRPFPVYILIVVVIIASISGIGISYYFFAKDNSVQEKVVTETKPALVATTNTKAFELTGTRVDILESLLSLIESEQNIVQLYPTTADETGEQKLATPEATLQKLASHTSGSFNRSVKEIVFGGIERTEPFIILRITSFDIAFAGILEWEKTLSSDLSPLFGEPVLETFDATARTATQLREAFYQDVLASNTNARVLIDETGADRIVYTFVNQQTILITTTRDALAKILPLIK